MHPAPFPPPFVTMALHLTRSLFAPPSGGTPDGCDPLHRFGSICMLLDVLLGLWTWPIPMGKISAQKATCRGERRWK
jgi:hypothetical protein